MLEEAKILKLSEFASDILEDIGNGICGLQTLRNGEMLVTKKMKCKNYIAKTSISQIINDLLIPFLDEIKIEKQWKSENEFIFQGTKITLIKWCKDDVCIIKYDDEKEIMVNKSYFRTLFESRNKLLQQPEYEQLKLII